MLNARRPDAPNVQNRISELTAIEGLLQTCQELKQFNKKMSVCVTGPFSNIAIFLLAFPKLAEEVISEFLVMGGAFEEPGNSNPSRTAEWNVLADTDAARILFQSHVIPSDFPSLR
jgi:inosine-uridine nucleoside N-ribohydrolase